MTDEERAERVYVRVVQGLTGLSRNEARVVWISLCPEAREAWMQGVKEVRNWPDMTEEEAGECLWSWLIRTEGLEAGKSLSAAAADAWVAGAREART